MLARSLVCKGSRGFHAMSALNLSVVRSRETFEYAERQLAEMKRKSSERRWREEARRSRCPAGLRIALTRQARWEFPVPVTPPVPTRPVTQQASLHIQLTQAASASRVCLARVSLSTPANICGGQRARQQGRQPSHTSDPGEPTIWYTSRRASPGRSGPCDVVRLPGHYVHILHRRDPSQSITLRNLRR